MIPLYISGCFAMLHPGRGGRGAVICGPLSDEALNSYRPLAFLAERLAAEGMPTLRLAYYGSGDSAGDDDEPNRFDQWLGSIRAGVAWLQEHCGVGAVTLIGHRVGASLAARAAGDIDAVDSLVLLAPSGGRQFLHELTLGARIAQRVWQTSHRVDDGAWFEAHGLRIDKATRNALSALDLRKLPAAPAAHALVLEQAGRSSAAHVVAALQASGTAVTCPACGEVALLQRDSFEAQVPHNAWDSVAQWMRSLPVPQVAGGITPIDDAVLHIGPAHETPIRFGTDTSLFGILTTPDRSSGDAPAVLLVNTSANPRWGNARVSVDIARALASEGVPSLRMDAAGMGDAALPSGELGKPYSAALTEDIRHGVAVLAQRTQRPVVVLGVCSGAYHALQAACRDDSVAGLILVNLQRFAWREGDPSDIVRRSALRPTQFYVRNLLSAQAWYRLIRADFDVANLARVFAARMMRRGIAALDPLLGHLPGGTRVGRVRRTMRMLSDRGVPILYVLGCNDPGVEELAEYFGRGGWRLQQQPNVTLSILRDADHTLGARSVRAALIEEIRVWCSDRWQLRAGAVRRPVVELAEHMHRDWNHHTPVIANWSPAVGRPALDETGAPCRCEAAWPKQSGS
ncbi:MAG TPA: alpha/beta hydrolase family protein [Acetobacteraceae bacterium]|jgi:dienelactone hydrolase